MFINLTNVLTTENKVVTVQPDIELSSVRVGDEEFAVRASSPVKLTLTNIGKGEAGIAGKAEFVLDMQCDRCLKPVVHKITLDFTREIYAPDRLGRLLDEAEDQSFIEGYQLNVEGLLENEIIINWPMKVLCKPDCKGICKQCGQDLNTGTCSCDTFVPDPRMAVIKDIFGGNKEV